MITDLDVLVLSCRSIRARGYIAEAVASYRAGAFRAAIVTTWIAVVFDFLDKLAELEAAGDKAAGSRLQALRGHQGKTDTEAIKASMDFENTLLDIAMNEFQFINPLQHSDLERLRNDRHRCAHPTVLDDETPYAPAAELARYHIRSAVDYLLSQPPVQGKAALDKLMSQVESELFPEDVDGALIVFRGGPLSRARDSLVRNFAVATTKMVITGDAERPVRQRGLVALQALHEMHTDTVERAITERLVDIVDRAPETALPRVLILLNALPILQAAVDEPQQLRLRKYVEIGSTKSPVGMIRQAMKIPFTREAALTRVRNLSDDALPKLLQFDPPPEAIDEVLARYKESGSFSTANKLGRDSLLPHLTMLTTEQTEALRRTILDNHQVMASVYAPRIVEGLLQLVPTDNDQARAPWMSFYDELNSDYHRGWNDGILAVVEERFPDLKDEHTDPGEASTDSMEAELET